MRKQKKIHFFRLDMYTLVNNEEGNPVQRLLTVEEKKAYLKEIVENRLNENNSIKVYKDTSNPGSSSAIFEVITDNDNYVFGKLGREHDINQFQIRKNDTLESSPIFKEEDELFESFSYVLIHKDTFSVSYIKEITAPSILYLGYLITNVHRDESRVWGLVESLMDEDAISLLSGKDIIGTMSYDMTIPSGYSNLISGLSEAEYGLLQNQKGTKVTIVLKAEKRKESVFENGNQARTFFQSVKHKFNNMKISAKDDHDEYMQDYKLVENPFTKKVNFNYDVNTETVEELQTQIEKQMWIKYQQNVPSIIEYLGFEA